MYGDVDIDLRGRGFRALWLFITMKDSIYLRLYDLLC